MLATFFTRAAEPVVEEWPGEVPRRPARPPFFTLDNFQLFIIGGACFFTFYPFLAGQQSQLETAPLRASVESPIFRESSVGILTLSLAFLADVVVDFSTHALSRHAYKHYTKYTDMLVDVELALFIGGVSVVPLVALLPSTQPLALAYTCASCAQKVLLGGFVARLGCRMYRPQFPMAVMLPSNVVYGVATAYMPFVLNSSSDLSTGSPTWKFVFLAGNVGGALYVLCCGNWLVTYVAPHVWPRLRRLGRRGGAGSKYDTATAIKRMVTEESRTFPIVYLLMATVGLLWHFAESFTDRMFYPVMSPAVLLRRNVPVLAMGVAMLVIKSQFSKYEVVERQLSDAGTEPTLRLGDVYGEAADSVGVPEGSEASPSELSMPTTAVGRYPAAVTVGGGVSGRGVGVGVGAPEAAWWYPPSMVARAHPLVGDGRTQQPPSAVGQLGHGRPKPPKPSVSFAPPSPTRAPKRKGPAPPPPQPVQVPDREPHGRGSDDGSRSSGARDPVARALMTVPQEIGPIGSTESA